MEWFIGLFAFYMAVWLAFEITGNGAVPKK